MRKWLFLGMAAALSVPALAGTQSAAAVRVEGAAATAPLTQYITASFGRSGAGIAVVASASGSAAALDHLCQGRSDIANTTRPISREEWDACRNSGIAFVEVPLVMDALAVVVQSGNTYATSLSVDDLRRVWGPAARGKLKRWSQINPSWPDIPLVLMAPDLTSGDGDYFNQAVGGKQISRRDFMASSEDETLIQGIANSSYALGYVSLASYREHKKELRLVPIAADAASPPVEPSATSLKNGNYQPLTRPIFMYVSVKAFGRPEVRRYVEFTLGHAAEAAMAQGYGALDESVYRQAWNRMQKQIEGSVWDGAVPTGLKANDLRGKYGAL